MGQNPIALSDVLPPPPNAAELGKFGNVSVGLHTGTPGTSIPIWTLNSRTITVPVTLAYNAVNLKVDQIASRAGMNWVLQAGGVVSRTVYGGVDEEVTKIRPPEDYGDRSSTFLDFLKNATTTRFYDAQYDVFNFSFNGMSGRFVLDSALKPVFLEKSNCRINTNFSPTADWTFKITDGKGMEYYFGGVGATEKTKSQQSACGKSYDQYKPTSWYLKRIVDPGVDTVQFIYNPCIYYYKTGISETAARATTGMNCSCAGGCSSFNNRVTCVQELATEGVILSEIQTSAYSKIGFSHTERMDVTHDSLINKMTIYQRSGSSWTSFKTVNFNYQIVEASAGDNQYNRTDPALRYRPFLSGIRIASADNTIFQDYQFVYKDPAGLPKRLSYCQDLWGCYNGKTINGTLLYAPDDPSLNNLFSGITFADRSASHNYAELGLLKKIVYPTGGYDSLVYEPNSANVAVTSPVPKQIEGVRVLSDQYRKIVVQRDTFMINYPLQGDEVSAEFLMYGQVYANPEDQSPHQQSIIRVIDKATNQIVYSQTYRVDFNVTTSIRLKLRREYILEASAEAEFSETTADAYITYVIGEPTTSYQDKIFPGLRVARTIAVDPAAGVQTVKRYYYAGLGDFNRSSGYTAYPVPVNFSKFIQIVDCPVAGVSSPCVCGEIYTLLTSSIGSVYLNPNGPIAYSVVVEGNGENFENGGIEHVFERSGKVPAYPILNAEILGAPYTDVNWPDGLEKGRNTFKKSLSGNFVFLEQVSNFYKMDSRGDVLFENYMVENKLGRTSFSDPPSEYDFASFNAMLYYLAGNWTYLDSTHIVSFTEAGDSLVRSTKYYYDNATHLQLTKEVTTNSQASPVTKVYKFPNDKQIVSNLTVNASLAIDSLVARNMLSTPVETELQVGNSLQQRTRTNFKNWAIGGKIFVLPENVEQQIRNAPAEKRIEFSKYDQYGRLVEQSKALDVKKSYIWDYRNVWPVAEVTNADAASVAYTSFEADGLGGWTMNSGSTIINGGVTGNKSVSGGVNKTVAAGNYIVGVWSTANTWINGQLQTQTPAKNLGTWRYFEVILSNVTSINVTGDNIDEVKLLPAGAQMATYAYDPLLGMTSQCDVGNNITYYEYDAFGRLLRVKDENKNILKQFDYRYQVFAHGNPMWSATGNTRCAPCPQNANYTTNMLQNEEKDINPGSPTYNQSRWLDAGVSSNCVISADWQNTAMAVRCKQINSENTGEQEQEQRDMNPCSGTYNQSRWVVVGTNTTACPLPAPVCNSSNCSGISKKCINGVCVTGVLKTISSVRMKEIIEGQTIFYYMCTQKYCFPDGTMSTESVVNRYDAFCPTQSCSPY